MDAHLSVIQSVYVTAMALGIFCLALIAAASVRR